jgi:hypothetical protein
LYCISFSLFKYSTPNTTCKQGMMVAHLAVVFWLLLCQLSTAHYCLFRKMLTLCPGRLKKAREVFAALPQPMVNASVSPFCTLAKHCSN